MKQHMKRIFTLLLVCSMLVSSVQTILPVSAGESASTQTTKTVTKNFSTMSSLTELDADYEAYRFTSSGENRETGKPSEYWSCDTKVSGYSYTYSAKYLRPVHNASAGKITFLSYKGAAMKDFQTSVAIANNYTQYGVAVAPSGEFYSAENGFIVFVTGEGQIYIKGAINSSAATSTGSTTLSKKANQVSTSAITGFVSINNGNCQNTVYHLNVTSKNGVITAYIEEYPTITVSVPTTDKYKGGAFSIYSTGCNQGGFKDYSLHYTPMEDEGGTAVKKDFSTMSALTELDKDYEAYRFTSSGENRETGKPSEYWSCDTEVSGYSYTYSAKYLRPVHNASAGKITFLSYKGAAMKDFQTSVAIANNYTQYGVAVAPSGEFYSAENGFIVFVTGEGLIYIKGAIDSSAATSTGSTTLSKKANQVSTSAITTGFVGVDNGKCQNTVYHLNITSKNGVITAYIEEYPTITVSVPTTDKYKGGAFSLYSTGCNQGGFKDYSLNYTPMEDEGAGKTAAKNFSTMSALTELDEDYKAYRFASSGGDKETGKPSEYWTTNKKMADGTNFSTAYLRPLHKANANKVTLLTYEKQTMTNFESKVTFATNYTQYGLSLAPAGELFNSNNGISVYVNAEGQIIIQGAIDAATAVYDGDIIDYRDHRVVTGEHSDFAVPNASKCEETIYSLMVSVKDGVLTAYLEEYPELKIQVNVSDKYQGGVFSLYSTGYNQGGIKSFYVNKLEDSTGELPGPEEGQYIKSFTGLSSISQLENDFAAYSLDDIANEMQEEEITDVFQLAKGRLQSNLTEKGTETGGFGILTLKNKQYQNFELELKYEQGYMRYGVMFGTELGQFGYTGTGGAIRGKDGGVFVYTEAEGYRNARGSLTAEGYSNASLALARITEDPMLNSFWNRGSVEKNLKQQVLHTMVIRVVGDCMTVVVDGDEASKMTVRLDGYNGGYISLVTNARNNQEGSFNYLKITELDEDAELGVAEPSKKPGFSSVIEIKNEFDAYYLEDAAVSTTMEKVDLEGHWWINNEGFVARDKEGRGTETSDVEVLTYKKQKYTDFELSFTYQQTFNRTGIIIGTEAGEYPLGATETTTTAKGGVMLFMEAEGTANAMGDFVSGYTNESQVRQRVVTNAQGFTDEDGNASENVTAKKSHKVTVVVKDKDLFVFIDDSKEYAMYLRLPETYKGGYVSIFSAAPRLYGVDNFEVSETITTAIPSKTAANSDGTNMSVVFDKQYLDTSKFASYYLGTLDETGNLESVSFYDYWMLANGSLMRKSNSVFGSDAKNVSVLTYTERKYTDFVATFEYKKTPGRLMLLFGTENGSYPLYSKNGDHENGGVLLYPENDLGNGGGICALGDVKLATTQYRPLYREFPYAPGYHVVTNNKANVGDVHKMTVAVINKHVYIYLDDYGLVTQFDLSDDYKGGYVSLASTGTSQHGFLSWEIKEISSAGKVIRDVEQKRDITVVAGTPVESISLPGSVKVTMRDGSTAEVPVTWKDCGYDQATVGEYRFVGTLQPQAGISNEGQVSALLTVRVRESLPQTSKGTKTWTFDTADDLQDFKTYYVENATEGGVIEKDFPMWYVEKGVLRRDLNRSGNGSEKNNLYILTYTGRTYKNFELTVDVSQEYARQMVLFGSKTPGQYIDFADPKGETNPIAAFVEFEGNRNAIGNVINTNYYNRTSETVSNLRESSPADSNYYNKENPKESMGTMHTLKIRVVGDTISMYLDDIEEVFSGKIGASYEGGYISLVSASKATRFDNLSITALNEQGEPMEDNLDVAANGTLNLVLGEDAPAEEEPVVPVTPEEEEVQDNKSSMARILIPVISVAVILAAGGCICLVVYKKRKSKKEVN